MEIFRPHLLTHRSGIDGIKERPRIQKKYLRSKFFDKFQNVLNFINELAHSMIQCAKQNAEPFDSQK